MRRHAAAAVAGLLLVLPAATATAQTACAVEDPEGDATEVGPLGTPLPNDPSLDLRAVTVGLGADDVLAAVTSVTALKQEPARGQVYTVYLEVADTTFAVVAARYADSSTGFTVRRQDGESFTTVVRGLQGTFDDAASTVTVPVPLAALAEGAFDGVPLAPGTPVSVQRATSQRLDSPRVPDLLGLPADESELDCALAVGGQAPGGTTTEQPVDSSTETAPVPQTGTVQSASSAALPATGAGALPLVGGVLLAVGMLSRRLSRPPAAEGPRRPSRRTARTG